MELSHLPTFRLSVNGVDQTLLINDRLISITVNYSGGGESDSLDLSLEDSNPLKRLFAPLSKHDKIKVWMGYTGNLQNMGTFYVNGIDLKGGAGGVDTYSVSAKSIDTSSNLFDRNYEVWKHETAGQTITLDSIIKKIAGDHSLTPKVDLKLKSKKITREIQRRESDISFLRFLAEKFSAVIKFYDDKLLFLGKDSKSVSGIPILPVIVSPTDIMDWQVTFGNRWIFKKVTAEWWDIHEAKLKQESVTNSGAKNDKEYICKTIYNSAAEAKKGAETELQNLKAETNKLTLNLLGNPGIRPFTPVVLALVRKHVDGMWRVGDVTHTFSTSGYTTSLPDMSEM